MWNPKDNPSIFEVFADTILNSAKGFPDYELSDEGLPIDINDFTVWNRLIHLSGMVYKFDLFQDVKVEKIKNILDFQMFKWILSPDKFNYSKFQSKWLINYSKNTFSEILRKSEKFMTALENHLKTDFNEDAAKAYFKMKSLNDISKKKELN